MIRLKLQTSVYEMIVNVVSTVTGCYCDHCATTFTRVQQARLLASRGCVRFARRPSFHRENFPTFYACSHVSIVRLVQSTILVSRELHSHSSPLYHLPGELVSISSVPMPSIAVKSHIRTQMGGRSYARRNISCLLLSWDCRQAPAQARLPHHSRRIHRGLSESSKTTK